jgi:hypothetical protein
MKLTSDELNNQLAHYKDECGCAAGAKFMLITSVASLIVTIHQYGIISIGFLIHLPLIIFISILGAGLGKGIAILYARYKYKQLSKQLISSQSI